MKIAILGAGSYAGRVHVPNLRALDGVTIPAACRTRADKLEAFNRQHDIPRGYTDYREMIDQEPLDGIVIATPHRLHFEQARYCLERGIGVLLEKPMVLTNNEARELIEVVHNATAPLVIGYNRHWSPTHRRARELVRDGAIGRVLTFTGLLAGDILWLLRRDAPPEEMQDRHMWREGDRPNFRGTWEESGGGMFVDGGAHLVESVLWITGMMPAECYAAMDFMGCETDVNTSLTLRYPVGEVGSLTVVGCSRRLPGNNIRIFGTEGTLHITDGELTLERAPGRPEPITDLPAPGNPAAHLVAVLRGEAQVECTVDDGARAVAVNTAAYESARQNAPVAVETMP